MSSVDQLVSNLRRDGFVFLRDFFPTEHADEAAFELTRWYDTDLKDRAAQNYRDATFRGAAGTTVLTRPSHLMIDVYGRSPSLDQMVERTLTDPLSSGVLHKMAGKYLKFRGYNIRRMTGEYDPGPKYPRGSSLPHEWHRDSPGELGIGILLTDIPEGGNAGTAFVPGSHLFPYCPRWNTLFSSEYRLEDLIRLGNPTMARYAPFSRLLALKTLRRRREASGKRGDLFFFFNDVWHGRYPNLHGRQTMLLLLGSFATEFPFPDKVTPPAPDVLAKLPPAMRLAASTEAPVNEARDTVVHWMLENRRRLWPMSLFHLAQQERRLAVAMQRWGRNIAEWWRNGHHVAPPWRWFGASAKADPPPLPVPMGMPAMGGEKSQAA